MDDKECEDTYHQLVGMMANQHMEWVVKDVEARISRDEMISFDRASSYDSEQLTLFDEFTYVKNASLPEKTSVAQKRLLMLIDNIYHAVVDPAECEHFLLPYLNGKGIREVIFLSSDGNGRKVPLGKEASRKQLNGARQLGHALQSLRKAVIQEAQI